MGYLISLALIEDLPDCAPLNRLDQSVPWRAFSLPDSDITLVEWLHRPNPNNPPHLREVKFPALPEFARRPSGVSFPDEFGDRAPKLDQLYGSLLAQKRASNFPKVAVHLAMRLSELTNCRVATIMSDDDGWDFGCEAIKGSVDLVRFCAGEVGDCDEETGAFEFFTIHGSGISQRDVRTLEHKLLHEVASSILETWDSRLVALTGFDGDPKSLGLVEIGRACEAAPPDARLTLSSPRPFWKIW